MAVHVESLPDMFTADPPPRIAVAFVRPIAMGVTRFGIRPAEFSAQLGMPAGARDGMIPMTRFAELLEAIAVRKQLPELALELVRMLPLGTMGASDYAFSTSATLIEALLRVAMHVSAFTEVARYELHIEDDVARLELRHFYRPVAIVNELASAFAVRRFRDVLGDDRVRLGRVRFRHAARTAKASYEAFFGAPVLFGCEADDISFPRELLDAPLLTAEPALAQLIAENPLPLPKAPPEADFVDRVRRTILDSLGTQERSADIDDLASRLQMSPRSLQRKLQEHGLSASELVDDVRCQEAQALLARGELPLPEIAYRLGFRQVPSFSRAFRRWTGLTPQAFRARHAKHESEPPGNRQ